MEKNKIYELEVIDNGINFEGIARLENKVIFLPGAILGEKVFAKIIKNTSDYSIAKIENFLVKSQFREDAFCDVYKQCGGCSAQHIDYSMQLRLKTNIIKNILSKQKLGYVKVLDTIGMGLPIYYRNKVQYPVRCENGKNQIGFYSKRSHNIIQNSCCYIQNRVIDILAKEIFEEVDNAGFRGYSEENQSGDIRHIVIRKGFHTKEILVTVIVNSVNMFTDYRFKEIALNLTSKNSQIKGVYLNLNGSNTNEIFGDKTVLIAGQSYITEHIGELKYCIGPKSFFQVNTLQAEILYSTLKEKLNLTGNEILFDLYSGVGSIGIFLSDSVKKVYGIEIEEEAVQMANLNIQLNNVENAEYIAGSVEDKIEEFKQKNICPDVIVVDPPRKGLDLKSIEYILEFKPKKIGYVSCNPATLARDLKLFEREYEILDITPIDMFPQTSHVECVSLLVRKTLEK